MNVNELIAALQALPDSVRKMPVATHANGHSYSSTAHRLSHGPLMVAIACPNVSELHVLIGNMLDYKYPHCTVLHGGRATVSEEVGNDR